MLRMRIISLLAGIFSLLISLPAAAAGPNPCFSTLRTDNFGLRVPAVSLGGSLYALDFEFSGTGPAGESGLWFRLSGLTASSVTSCSYPAPLFIDGGKLILRVPMALYANYPFWTELQYVPSTDSQIWFSITGLGLMANQVFVTSSSGAGNLGGWQDAGGKTGLAAADAICQARASGAGLQGVFRAWLSDDSSDAYCRLNDLPGKKSANCGQSALPADAGPWVRTDGFPFADRINSMTTTHKIYTPVRNDEAGETLPLPTPFFTNTFMTGVGQTGNSCANWTSAGPLSVGIGRTYRTSGSFAAGSETSVCNEYQHLLCFQAGPGQPLPPHSLPGKKVFLSSAYGTGNLSTWPDAQGQGGVAMGDAVCGSLAAKAGLPNAGIFKAWLSDGSTNARDRLTSDGPWVRTDGVKVAETKADLTDGSLFTSISVTEVGVYRPGSAVWTGTEATGVKAADRCNDWTSGSPGSNGVSGFSLAVSDSWSRYTVQSCDQTFGYLYCFED